MDMLQIDATERLALTRLLDEIEGEFRELESDAALNRATVLAHELPERIRTAMNDFRRERMSGVLRLSGYVVDQERVGPTPAHWREQPVPSPARREEILLVLLSSLLGDPFGWVTQQDGHLIHDVLPIKGHERGPLASSSEVTLTWHTEDAFHPLRGDFLAFSCLRNPYAAATTVGDADSLRLPDPVKVILSQERFLIRPDESHFAANNSVPDAAVFADIDKLRMNPRAVAILFGDLERPYLRADPIFMDVDPADHEARHAFDQFVKAMDQNMFDLSLESGDFCFLDNFRVVHGRRPFKARNNGTDRWLKRLNVTGDLRSSTGKRVRS
jgi:Fe(II)/alpha-ketoglutarate-dependent arginine beta-hydroxylase